MRPWEWPLRQAAIRSVTGHFRNTCHRVEYPAQDKVRRVQDQGRFTFKGRNVKVSTAFKGFPVAVRPTGADGLWDVFFMTNKIHQIDLR